MSPQREPPEEPTLDFLRWSPGRDSAWDRTSDQMARRTAAAALAFHLRTGVESVSESVDSPYSFELRMDAEPKGVGPSKWNGLQRHLE